MQMMNTPNFAVPHVSVVFQSFSNSFYVLSQKIDFFQSLLYFCSDLYQIYDI